MSKDNRIVRLFTLLSFVLFLSVSSFAQNVKKITGTVTDDKGETLIGATVTEKGSSKGTVTDLDGNFSLDVSNKTTELQVTYVGYKTQTVKVPANGKLHVTLVSDEHVLQETVVIGYGVQRKSDLTGSVSSVSSKDFNQGVINSPEELINGKVSGVQIVNSGGSPSAGSTIRIRRCLTQRFQRPVDCHRRHADGGRWLRLRQRQLPQPHQPERYREHDDPQGCFVNRYLRLACLQRCHHHHD